MIRPRFTIGRGMVAVAVVAVGLALARVHVILLVLAAWLVVHIGLAWVGWRAWRRRASRPDHLRRVVWASAVGLTLWAAAWQVASFGTGIDPEPFFLLVTVVPPLVAGAVALGLADAVRPADQARRAGPGLGMVVVLALATVFTHWPAWAAFEWARPELDRLADRVEAGIKPTWPARAGPFRITYGEVYVLGSSNPQRPVVTLSVAIPTGGQADLYRPVAAAGWGPGSFTPSTADIPLGGPWFERDPNP